MNGLSWLLYLADVLPNLAELLGAFCFLTFLLGGIAYAISFDDSDYANMFPSGKGKIFRVKMNKFFIMAVIVGFISSLIPSKTTIYLIAASEVGEEALETEVAQKIEDYLDFILSEVESK